MDYRELGGTGMRVSTIGFGAWAIGGSWGPVNDEQSIAALHRALDLGVNFFDTADVYGDGRSERLLGRLRKERTEPFYVATKAGRRLRPHFAEGYDRKNLSAFVERSLGNLGVQAIDLLQLHCPPPNLYERDEPFDALDGLVKAGKVRFFGVSVETVAEARRALHRPNVKSIQIIFNMLRLKPAEDLFPELGDGRVGILARVPLASGLLTGKLKPRSSFAADDHRSFNRYGQAFDRGETFSGVDYDTGLVAVEELRAFVPPGATLAQMALRFVTTFPQVTSAIPGAKSSAQVEENVGAASLSPLSDEARRGVQAIYDRLIRRDVHPCW